jgi:hypothetical protein
MLGWIQNVLQSYIDQIWTSDPAIWRSLELRPHVDRGFSDPNSVSRCYPSDLLRDSEFPTRSGIKIKFLTAAEACGPTNLDYAWEKKHNVVVKKTRQGD